MVSLSCALFQETISSASSITQGLTTELLDGQRKLLALVASGSPISQSTSVLQPTNGPVPKLPEVLKTNIFRLSRLYMFALHYFHLLRSAP